MTTNAQVITPDDLRHLAQAIGRAGGELGGGLGRLVEGWSESMMLLATGFEQNMKPSRSAEKLSIEMMAQASELLGRARENMDWVEVESLGERLAMWATDARMMGVEHFRALSLEKQTAQAAVDRMANAERRLGLVREVMDNRTGQPTGEMLRRIQEAIDE